MPYITRGDGQHFVIPSYRDVLTVKQKSQLKKEILLLSKSYGEYITLQKKNAQQYEVAFSSDTGYLLGESIWHYFKKPVDMIYCEAIPDTTEAILVIVKAGSVYLDGSFPLESIPEELIIFLTQQNNFEIYTYGDVPISKEPETGKFSFEEGSVKSFSVLDSPVFPKLPLLRIYQLKPVETVLREHGIGAFPLKQLILLVLLIALGWWAYNWFTTVPPPPPPEEQPNPYQAYYDTLKTPAPDEEISKLVEGIKLFMQISGWAIVDFKYAGGTLTANLVSNGGTVADLYAFANTHKATVAIQTNGISISMNMNSPSRPVPNKIYSSQKVLAAILDRLVEVIPGNNMSLATIDNKNVFTSIQMAINLSDISPTVLDLIGKQLKGLPVVLDNVSATVSESGNLTGTITIYVVGS